MPLDLPELPSPHGEKLAALKENPRLPTSDLARVQATEARYLAWRDACLTTTGTREEVVSRLVELLQAYKLHVDLELIFDSPEDWLYRQKGQTKIDNSIIEEFLPILVVAVFGEQLSGDIFRVGPTTCFSTIRFVSTVLGTELGAGASIKSKDQDFAIARPVFVQTSHYADFRDSQVHETSIAYVAAECKTNLDKTMFQEAAATAQDVKTTVSGAKYFLLCEWLDMRPISTSVTPIDEILILRKAKRLGSNVRSQFSRAAGRRQTRDSFEQFLNENPFDPGVFGRFIDHLERVVQADALDATMALNDGFF